MPLRLISRNTIILKIASNTLYNLNKLFNKTLNKIEKERYQLCNNIGKDQPVEHED